MQPPEIAEGYDMLGNLPVFDQSLSILADRPEVGPYQIGA